jgi:hypothetical protein
MGRLSHQPDTEIKGNNTDRIKNFSSSPVKSEKLINKLQNNDEGLNSPKSQI